MKHTFTIFLLLLVSTTVVAQRNCPTIADLAQMQAQDPVRYQNFMDLKNFTANFIANQGSTGQWLIRNYYPELDAAFQFIFLSI